MESPSLVTEVANDIVVVRFNKPARRNPLSLDTLGELETLLSDFLPRKDLRAIVFTGTDDVFASGADIRELAQLTPSSALDFAHRGQTLFQSIANARQITIAAINGYCMGGALDLALSCDIRIASTDAAFAHPGARLGIITGWGGTQRLQRLIGRARAIELFATASIIGSEVALSTGLVTWVGDPVLHHAFELI